MGNTETPNKRSCSQSIGWNLGSKETVEGRTDFIMFPLKLPCTLTHSEIFVALHMKKQFIIFSSQIERYPLVRQAV